MNHQSRKLQKISMINNIMKESHLDFSVFVYGILLKVKIRKQKLYHDLVLIYHQFDQMYFALVKENGHIKNLLFIPQIESVRYKEKTKKNHIHVKIRMKNLYDFYSFKFSYRQKNVAKSLYNSLNEFYKIIESTQYNYYCAFGWKHMITSILYKQGLLKKYRFNINQTKAVKKLQKSYSQYTQTRLLLDRLQKIVMEKNGTLNPQQQPLNEHNLYSQELYQIKTISKEADDIFNEFNFLFGQQNLLKREIFNEILKRKDKYGSQRISIKDFEEFVRSDLNFQYEKNLSQQCTQFVRHIFFRNMFEMREFVKQQKVKNFRPIKKLNFPQFAALLHSDFLNHKRKKEKLDLTHPFKHYFVKSSHNTYLLGNQLIGQSCVEGYILALKQGFKCLEIDLWNGKDGEPIVRHGWTLVTTIQFEDVVKTLAEHAFKYTELPLILSLEIHCNWKQRKRIAEIIKKYMDQYLVKLNGQEFNYTLQQLCNRVLIKAKILFKDTIKNLDPDNYILHDPLEEITALVQENLKQKDEVIETIQCNALPNKTISFEASSILWKKYTKAEIDLFNKNMSNKYFIRVYPKGTNFFSGNYDPSHFWELGCQLVSLNLQTRGKAYMINRAFFNIHDQCQGYILKPAYMTKLHIQPTRTKFSMQVICCQFFRKHSFLHNQATLKITLHGIKQNKSNNEVIKLTLKPNLLTPEVVERDQLFHFDVVKPELCFLIFQVKKLFKTLAIGCICLKQLQTGISTVKLYSKKVVSNKISSLIVKFNVENNQRIFSLFNKLNYQLKTDSFIWLL